jgi:hypothetical protein
MNTDKFLEGFEQFIKEANLEPQAAFAVRYCLPMVDFSKIAEYAKMEKESGALSRIANFFRSSKELASETMPEIKSRPLGLPIPSIKPLPPTLPTPAIKPPGGMMGGLKSTAKNVGAGAALYAGASGAEKLLNGDKPAAGASAAAAPVDNPLVY